MTDTIIPTNLLTCLICGQAFPDAGCHPLICGNRNCAREAERLGWWDRWRQYRKDGFKGDASDFTFREMLRREMKR